MNISENAVGSNFEEFLHEERIFEEVDAAAAKQFIALQIGDVLREQGIPKTELARRMKSSRAAVDRLLDPDNSSVTLLTLARAAAALERHLVVRLA